MKLNVMKRITAVCVCLSSVLALSGCAGTAGSDTDPFSDYGNLVWSDEFDGTALDESRWTFDLGYGVWGNGEIQNYTDKNLKIADGVAVLKAEPDPSGEYAYTSARITTENLETVQYGLIEARIRMTEASGFLPAFWLLTEDETYGEIDIMEHIADEPFVYGTAHWAPDDPDGSKSSGSDGENTEVFPDDFSAGDWHVYAVERTEDAITWYVDDTAYYRLDLTSLDSDAREALCQKMYLILNLAAGGEWPGNPEKGASASMQVDYVRIYSRKRFARG